MKRGGRESVWREEGGRVSEERRERGGREEGGRVERETHH